MNLIINQLRKMSGIILADTTAKIDQVRQELLNRQIDQRQLYLKYLELKKRPSRLPGFQNVGFRVYSQTDEDGILVYIFSLLGFRSKIALDIAFGNPYGANTTNLICNWGFSGLLIEGDKNSVHDSGDFFAKHPDSSVFPPIVVNRWITAENVNTVVKNNGLHGEIDIFSLDMDGMDFWVWKSLNVVSPRIVIVEAATFWRDKVAVTAPYNPAFERHKVHPDFMGASIPAFIKLGKQKGFRLVACNRFGYNLIFVRHDVSRKLLPEISAKDCFYFESPALKNKRLIRLTAVKDYPWVKV